MAKVARKPRLSIDALREYAVRALSQRAHSIGELRCKLVQRANQPDDVDKVIYNLHDYGYLNDQRFAESYAGARLDNQGLGKSRVLRDLRARKVSAGVAEQAVAQVYREVDEMELIEKFLARKVRTKTPLPEALGDPKQLASVYRKLIHAGFAPSNAIQALKRIAKEHDSLDSFEPPEAEDEG